MIRASAAVALLALATAARAHEVSHEIVRGRAIAVRAAYAGGEPLAYVEYQVFSPRDATIPWQKGRTDRAGWVSFVPSEPGSWRVRVFDATGHGFDVTVPAEAAFSSAVPAGGAGGTLGYVLRPVAGVAALGLVFAALIALHRWRRPPP